MKKAFIYTDTYLDYDYGPTHPLRISRLKLTYELIRAYGLLELPLVQFIPTMKAKEEDLAIFHSREYLNILREVNDGHLKGDVYSYGLGPGDNPIFPGFYDWSLWVTGATLQAVDFVVSGKGDIAFNIAGGLHHAKRSRASGFCYINDPVIGIMRLLEKGKRVAYIDIDAHHGDGVQEAFYDRNEVLTISLHQSGYTLFPGTGFEYEIGEGQGEGYSINIPFPPYTDDETYLWAFEEVFPELIQIFKPDVIVTQLGVDTFYSDPLTNLNLTIYGFERVLQRIKALAIPWIALGGGGYNISNVARAWTLAWAIMNGIELSDELPKGYIKFSENYGVFEKRLKGTEGMRKYVERGIRKDVERIVLYIKETIIPKILKDSESSEKVLKSLGR